MWPSGGADSLDQIPRQRDRSGLDVGIEALQPALAAYPAVLEPACGRLQLGDPAKQVAQAKWTPEYPTIQPI
jgi:hypothetical protein